MDELAKQMGFKGQSSIQRYLSPDYDKGFRPELAARFKAALIGLGEPPITPADLHVFNEWTEGRDGTTVDMPKMFSELLEAGQSPEEYHDKLVELGLAERDTLMRVVSRLRKSPSLEPTLDQRVVGLPLEEGDVVVRLPKHLSKESADALRTWFEHLVGLATLSHQK
jgi:hypothetical protein